MKQKIHIKKSGFGADFDFNLRYRTGIALFDVETRQIRPANDSLTAFVQRVTGIGMFAGMSTSKLVFYSPNFIAYDECAEGKQVCGRGHPARKTAHADRESKGDSEVQRHYQGRVRETYEGCRNDSFDCSKDSICGRIIRQPVSWSGFVILVLTTNTYCYE